MKDRPHNATAFPLNGVDKYAERVRGKGGRLTRQSRYTRIERRGDIYSAPGIKFL